MAVMIDPKTGELLALASAPRFNPNTPEKSSPGDLRNRSVERARFTRGRHNQCAALRVRRGPAAQQ